MNFTLYYDYGQLRSRRLYRLSPDGQIEWFRRRMTFVFLESLTLLYQADSRAFRDLNSTKKHDLPPRSFVIPTFAMLLNGVEALGSFLTPAPDRRTRHGYNRDDFFAFMELYMKPWDKAERKSPYATIKDILWRHFRNGIDHGFCIQGGGIDNEADTTRWRVVNRRFQIGPNAFFRDFRVGINTFFTDAATIHRTNFLRRFREVYPP